MQDGKSFEAGIFGKIHYQLSSSKAYFYNKEKSSEHDVDSLLKASWDILLYGPTVHKCHLPFRVLYSVFAKKLILCWFASFIACYQCFLNLICWRMCSYTLQFGFAKFYNEINKLSEVLVNNKLV